MVDVYVNDNLYKVKHYLTIIQVCSEIGIDIPRFCYHELLSIAGNCRMCLVEVEKSLKPVASCAMPISQNMKIYTDSLLVRKAREGVMELLLANHPLDCPICDQGGECDLQDQAMVFGSDRGRFYEYKRATEDKNCGPLIKTVMTRCIHCTRCVRYSIEVAGIKDLGVTGRGNSMEIGTYIDKMLLSTEISGNIIDLCPVGALTSKPYAFTARSWELKTIETIDLFDSIGSNILMCIRGNDLMRVLPRKNSKINESWISDKVRFNYDGLKIQRLLRPLIKINDNFINVSWELLFSKLLRIFYSGKINLQGLLGNDVDLETSILIKDLFNKFGVETINLKSNSGISNIDFSQNYKFNSTIVGFDKTDLCVLVGLNIRLEFPLLAARLRKLQNKNGLNVIVIGSSYDYNLDVNIIGNGGNTFFKFLEGRLSICTTFMKAKNPLLCLGANAMGINNLGNIRNVCTAMLEHTNLIKDSWNGLNISSVGNVDVGFFELGIMQLPRKVLFNNTNKNVLYLFGVDEIEYNLDKKNSYIIYQGHHGDIMAGKADMIIPGVTFIEKEGTYVNIEGRAQQGKFVTVPGGNARTDWQILSGLLEYLFYSNNKFYKNIYEVRQRINEVYPCVINVCNYGNLYVNTKGLLKITNVVFNNVIYNYYMTDNISRSSKIMGICSKKIINMIPNYNINLNLAINHKMLKEEKIC